MSERTQATDEQKAVLKERRDERNTAVKDLIALVIASEDATAEMKALAELAKPKTTKGSGVSRTAAYIEVSAMFNEFKEIDEVKMFMDLKLGRGEMGKIIKNIIKCSIPEERKWIKFNPEEGFYSLEGLGASAPEGWTGYIPAEEIVED